MGGVVNTTGSILTIRIMLQHPKVNVCPFARTEAGRAGGRTSRRQDLVNCETKAQGEDLEREGYFFRDFCLLVFLFLRKEGTK